MVEDNKDIIEILTTYIKENETKLYRLSYSYVKDKEIALDVIQDAIVKSISKIHTLKNKEYVKTWFYRILINQCLSYVKINKRGEELNIDDYDIDIEDNFVNIDIYNAIDKLNPKLKTIIILRYFENMKLEEIAKITKANLSTVKSRLYKAIKELRKELYGLL